VEQSSREEVATEKSQESRGSSPWLNPKQFKYRVHSGRPEEQMLSGGSHRELHTGGFTVLGRQWFSQKGETLVSTPKAHLRDPRKVMLQEKGLCSREKLSWVQKAHSDNPS
jgi:hypothetical protein